jgi:hypothetical protein
VQRHAEGVHAAVGGPRAGDRRPAVGGGVVAVTVGDQLLAFDAAGTTGCAGSPKICSPRWRAEVPDAGLPAIGGGRVFVGSDEDLRAPDPLFAFDARGRTGCSGVPKVCQPLWRSRGPGGASPVVAGGVVYGATTFLPDGGTLFLRVLAFDATGGSGCSGTPRRCPPLWISDTELFDDELEPPPAVAEGRLYVELSECCHEATGYTTLLQYEATADPGCPGRPMRCQPITSVHPDVQLPWIDPPAAGGGGRVFVSGPVLHAYARDGLAPLWKSEGGSLAAPGLTHGVVYTIGGTGQSDTVGAVAYDAAGIRGCSGSPARCTPLWRSRGAPADDLGAIFERWATPVVADGTVFVRLGRLFAYRLPGT